MRALTLGTIHAITTRTAFLVAISMLLDSATFASPPYPLGIACVTNIDFNGNNVRMDSFDSSDPNHSDWSTNGGYGTYVVAKAKANGNVGTDASIVGATVVGQANIYGRIDTAPGGSFTIGNYGYVGPLPQVGIGIQPGYSNDDMNVVFPDVILPANANNWQAVGSNSIINYSGNYYISGISNNLTINASNVLLYVAGNITLSGTQAITIGTNATTVTIYAAGPLIDIQSGGAIGNLPQRASVLKIYGLPTLTNMSLVGTGMFTGTIYAPETDLGVGGGGTSVFDLIGSTVTRSLKLNSHANFHFDEALASSMPLWISTQPTNHVLQLGTNATFAISVGGGYALGYQWFFNQTNLLANATNFTLSLTNIQVSNEGAYSVIATNFAGSITSSPASLIVYSNAAATLITPLTMSNGFQFTVTGVPGLDYIVQSSTNLSDWIPLTTNQPPFTLLDTKVPLAPLQFYRAICFPSN